MEIIDEKHCSGKLIRVADSLEYFGYEPDELLEEAENCRLELYVALKPFKAKLIAINKPVSLLPDPALLKAELSSGGGDDESLLPKYTRMILRFGEAEIKYFPANIPNDENYIYQWELEEPQKVDISYIYVYSEHLAKKFHNSKTSCLDHGNSSDSNSQPNQITNNKPVSQPEIPAGKQPRIAVGKLAVKAAWEIECSTKKRATAKEVLLMLQNWADKGVYPDTLLKSNKHCKAVTWLTGKSKQKDYTLEACEKALEEWHKNRAHAVNLSRI